MGSPTNDIIVCSHVYLDYQNTSHRTTAPTIIEDANFTISRGEKYVIIGPSGCWKTTLLKALTGFLKPRQGEILVNDQPVKGPGPNRVVDFQDFEQLFAWRTVLGNVVYALRMTRQISE